MNEHDKNSLNLPNTAFPMKANLAQREPEWLKHWDNIQLYQKIQEKNKGKPKFILPDGPPYANGEIHLGHAVNKILKDMILKSKILSGFLAPFVPGWDCHGLPIELNVEKQVGRPGVKVDAKTFRQKCREYVLTQVEAQRAGFIRLGILGDWQNPYLTMDYKYEADIIRSLSTIAANGHLHKGFKPVHWCIDCGSALAEAEVEYADKTSPAIDVCFPVLDPNMMNVAGPFKQSLPETASVSVVIWTTTPWTLPANQAVAVHPDLTYVLLKSADKYYIVVSNLVDAFSKRTGLEDVEIVGECLGGALENTQLQHPFYDKCVPIVLGEHVTVDTGTGLVHTAPVHGVDDYMIGIKYHLSMDNPVNANGCYHSSVPLFAGEHVFKANDKVIEILKEKGHLLSFVKMQHSYPHCWRHKSPLIFRATQQWFVGMDQNGLRTLALDAIQKVNWIPEWGQARIEGMVRDRPDWCISRQRTWCVPMCLFVHKESGELHPKTAELMEAVAKKVEQAGIEAWYELTPEELLGSDAEWYEKSSDALDVWFDSGVMHTCVLEKRLELGFPADLFLEGSDQHRGWFQSSLLTSVAMKQVAPYKQVLTHGFTVDALGRKMSKSLGNVIAPDKVTKTLGADILRLWVSATDYRSEMSVSDEILKRMSDSYRRIRNTIRFLLANLNGFDPKQDRIAFEDLIVLDQWVIDRARVLQQEIIQAYSDYQFHTCYQKIQHFCSIDLGSFYLDIIKDRQYTGKRDGLPRRSAQTALYYLVECLVRWIAPILSFTAEEIWQNMPGDREGSVFLSEWYAELPTTSMQGKMTQAFWDKVLVVRECVNKTLEEARAAGSIGSGLEAEVNLYCHPEHYELLTQLKDELRFVLITSQAKIYPADERPSDAKETSLAGLWVVVQPSIYPKCDRCWHRREDVNQNSEHPGICSRCVENVAGNGETRIYA